MKYLVMEIQKFDNGAISTPTYAYDERNSAEAKFHTILAAAAVSALPMHSCVMITEDGRVVRNEHYEHIIEPEPEPFIEPDDDLAPEPEGT